MLDMKFVRENPEKVIEAVHNRNGELNLEVCAGKSRKSN